MIIYVDTSVLVAAFTEEAHSDAAQREISGQSGWRISDWACVEFSAAIRAKCRRGELDPAKIDTLDHALSELIRKSGEPVAINAEDVRVARDLVIEDGLLRGPDALHLAITRRVRAQLFTFDINQTRAARAWGLGLYSA